MKKILFLIVILLFGTQVSFACMPFSYNLITVWVFEWIEKKIHPYEWEMDFIYFSDIKKPFPVEYLNTWKYYYLSTYYRKFDLSNYKKWDLIITITDSTNWSYEDYFSVYEIWKLVLNTKGELDIIDPQWYIKDRSKTFWQCGNYKPDNVMDKDDLLYKVSDYLNIWIQSRNKKIATILWITSIITSINIINSAK